MVSSPSSQSPLEARLERVERALATISAEVASIRAAMTPDATASAASENGSAGATGAAPAPERRIASPSDRRAKNRAESPLDFERLLGRYGMLVIAVVAAVAAVGTFLSWAIGHGYLRLDPASRVLVGLAAAGGLGIWGLRLRRSERSFGSSIVALALVIVQVCAYAAGPKFQLVPSWMAFAGVALLSWVLAIAAHIEDDEPLWCVGFGGAAIAPFVTSNGSGNLYALLIYGLAVLLPACFAISHKGWPVAWRVFYLVSALFSLAGADMAFASTTPRFLAAFAFPFIVATAGIVPFAPDSRKRAALRWLAILGAATTLSVPYFVKGAEAWTVVAFLVGAVALWLFLLDRQAFLPQSSLLERTRSHPLLLDWLDVLVIPLVIVMQATVVLRNTTNPFAVSAIATILFTTFAWRRAINSLRDAAAFAAVLYAAATVAALPIEEPLFKFAVFVLVALAALGAHRARPSLSWLLLGIVGLVVLAVVSAELMFDRTPYRFTPFATEPSATAAVLLVAFVCVSRFWSWLRVSTRAAMGPRPEWTYAQNARLLVRGAALSPWIWAFLWVLIELSMAYSPSASTLLLVTYFAATAVACVGAGRMRHSARLRQTGLALALAAAATAFYGATTYFDFAARIAGYLVTSAFLLGIAYWYRRPGETREDGRLTV